MEQFLDVIMEPVTNSSCLLDPSSQGEMASLWEGRLVSNHFISSDTYLLSMFFLENCFDLEQLPRASSGSAPVYFPPNLPVVFKKTGEIKSLTRFNTMCEVRELCEKRNYENLKIPKARPYGDFIIEERLPIVELKQKSQVGLYCENREKFSLAVKEFTQLLCQVEYPDILTSTHPYQQSLDMPLARYDNIPFFLENEKGMIGLIDLEDVKIRGKTLCREEVLEIAKQAVLLFPYHLNEILSALRAFFPHMELDFSILKEEHLNILKNFNTIYFDHLSFILNEKAKFEIPLVSEARKNEIKNSILLDLKEIDLMDRVIIVSLIEELINQIEIDLKKSLEKDFHFSSSNINLTNSRTLSLPFKKIGLTLASSVEIESIIKSVLKELKNGNDICYENLYYNHAGELMIRIHL